MPCLIRMNSGFLAPFGGWPMLFRDRVYNWLPHPARFSQGGHDAAGSAVLDLYDAIGALLSRLRDVTDCQFGDSRFIHHNRSRLAVSVVAIAAPTPLLRFEHQAAFDRVVVHVAQLLDPVVLGEDDEVIEASLPDVSVFQG